MPEQEIINLASEELHKTRIVKDARILDGYVHYIPRCYPVYEKGYHQNLDLVKIHLDCLHGLQAIGRYGAFNYTNQDHSILMGLLAAENVANTYQHDLWEINSEVQYQENSVINEHGVITY
jgi:Protoporphyrinogen oxidase